MLRSIGKQSGESAESVLKKKRKATVRRIAENEGFKPVMEGELWLMSQAILFRAFKVFISDENTFLKMFCIFPERWPASSV